MHRFFCPDATPKNDIVCLTDKKEIHHLKDVLRLKAGEEIIVFDGRGTEIKGTIVSIRNDAVHVRVDERLTVKDGPAQIQIVLACAIPKKAKFETIIEKSTELGVDEIIPLITERTEVSRKAEVFKKKNARYLTIAINAAKQSRRKTIPAIQPVMAYPEAIHRISANDVAFIPHLGGEREDLIVALQTLGPHPARILVFIGPEGDFTPDEVALAIRQGCRPVSLGKTVLKVDTAAIAVMSLTNLFFRYEK